MMTGFDREQLEELLETAECNLRALELFSSYLHICPRFVKEADIQSLTQDCGVDVETAQRLLVSAACGLDPEENARDRVMEERYLRHAIHLLDAKECSRDPYYQTIRLPEISRGRWKMGYKTIAAYELFTSDDLRAMPDGREIPQTGFFTRDFRAPVVEENGREWMTVTPSEINTMTADIRAAYGKVAVFGLGLGYYAFMVSEKSEVTEVTVIERDPEVISLFREFILPQFPHKEKVTVIEADAYAFAAAMGDQQYDCAYVDIWHDVLDGVEMYLKMKRLEKSSPGTKFLYWIEPSMLAWLRGMALMEIAENTPGPMLAAIGNVNDVAMLKEALKDENLRRIAANIPLEVARP
ncbi:MAG: hypothetical protein IKK75_10800 [Clostridia bacterium]|nr:hypothetical protein [Clostridia bacterium]